MLEGLLQPTHLILILIAVLIIFGAGKLPEIGSALGRSIREFKGSLTDDSQDSGTKTVSDGITRTNVIDESVRPGAVEQTNSTAKQD